MSLSRFEQATKEHMMTAMKPKNSNPAALNAISEKLDTIYLKLADLYLTVEKPAECQLVV